MVTATLTPERANTLRPGSVVALRYRIDKGQVHDEGWNWSVTTDGRAAITFSPDAVDRLLTRIADAKETIVFSVGNNSARVDVADTDYAETVADLRTRCATFNES